MVALSPRLRLLIGLAGSLAVLAGSLGVGRLPPVSPIRDLAVMAFVRNSRGAVLISELLIVAGILLLLFAWLSLGLSLRPGGSSRAGAAVASVRQVVASIVAWSAPLLLAFPLFSRDIFAYVGQGRLLASGLDPYTDVMADVPGWFEAGVDPKWSETVTPYGPLFVFLQAIIVQATAAFPTEVALLVTRLLSVAGFTLLLYYGWRIARLRGSNEAAVLWAIGASPLVLMNFVVAGHNDALMLGLIVAGAYQALKGRPILATLLVAAAAGVKPIALLALPVIGIIWAGADAGWGRLIARWAAVAALALGSILAFGVGLGAGAGWIAGLGTPLEIGSWYSVPRILSLRLRDVVEWFGGDGPATQSAIVLGFLVLGCVILTYLLTVKRRSDPIWLLAGSFAAIALCSPLLHPWYGLWLMSLFGIAGLRRLWQVRLLIYATAFLAVIGLTDGVDLIDRFRADPALFPLYWVAGTVGAAVLIVWFEVALHRRFRARGVPAPMLAPAGAFIPAR